MNIAIAIFAKTIGLSEVKTRLAADIGKAKAEEFYALSKKSVEACVRSAVEDPTHRFSPFWALAEENGPDHIRDSLFPAMWTGDGGLGTRLATISERLFADHDAVFLIGTDSPQLSPDYLGKAADLLATDPSTAIAGPAEDGGFYLFATARPIARETWEAVQYSRDTTLGKLEERLQDDGISVRRIETAQDVDLAEDLPRLRDTLRAARSGLLEEQRDLLSWLEANETLF